MSLRDQIESDVEDVFLNTDDFAVTAQHYPSGDINSAGDTITVIFDRDREEGTNQFDGDGRFVTNERTGQIRDTAVLEVPVSVVVNYESGMRPSSLFVINDEHWRAKREEGRDDFLQAVVAVKVDKKLTRQATRQ